MKNIKGKWSIAYHGVGRHENSENIQNIVRKTCKTSTFGKHTNDDVKIWSWNLLYS